MPTYSYACPDCGHTESIKQRMSDDKLVTCPACGQTHYERLISGGTGFLLKGGGWYADGYSGGSKAPEKGGSEQGSPDKSGSDASSSDSSPAPAASGGCGGSCACH